MMKLLAMNIETIIINIISSQAFQNSTNQKGLLKEAKNLINLFKFHTPFQNSIKIFQLLKANLFYQTFNGLPFLKTFINEIEDTATIRNILALNINYSKAEKKALHNSLSLSILYRDLKEEEKYEENQDNDEQNFEIYFEDFKKLKTILSSEKVFPEDIEWFLNSDLFDLISEFEDIFTIKIKDIYRLLLANTEIKKNSEFNKHRTILVEKSSLIIGEPKDDAETPVENISRKNEKLNQISELISILNAQKKRPQPPLGKGIFYIPKVPVYPNKRKMDPSFPETEPDINNSRTKRLKF